MIWSAPRRTILCSSVRRRAACRGPRAGVPGGQDDLERAKTDYRPAPCCPNSSNASATCGMYLATDEPDGAVLRIEPVEPQS